MRGFSSEETALKVEWNHISDKIKNIYTHHGHVYNMMMENIHMNLNQYIHFLLTKIFCIQLKFIFKHECKMQCACNCMPTTDFKVLNVIDVYALLRCIVSPVRSAVGWWSFVALRHLFCELLLSSEALFLVRLGRLGFQRLPLVLPTQLYPECSLHLGDELVVGNSLPLLVLSDNLRFFVDLGCQILLRHLLGLPALLDQLAQIEVDSLVLELLSLGVKLGSVHTRALLGIASRSVFSIGRDGHSLPAGDINGLLLICSSHLVPSVTDNGRRVPVISHVYACLVTCLLL